MAGVTICSDFGAQENKSVTALLPLFPHLFCPMKWWSWMPWSQCFECCILCHSIISLCEPLDNSPPGSSVHGIFQTRILKWVAISSFNGSTWPTDWTHICSVSCIGRQILYHCATWEAQLNVEFKPIFSRFSFTFIKKLFSSSSLSVLRVASFAYLKLLIFLLGILIPACAWFQLVLHPAQHFAWCILHIEEGNGTPLQYSCLENPMDGGAW